MRTQMRLLMRNISFSGAYSFPIQRSREKNQKSKKSTCRFYTFSIAVAFILTRITESFYTFVANVFRSNISENEVKSSLLASSEDIRVTVADSGTFCATLTAQTELFSLVLASKVMGNEALSERASVQLVKMRSEPLGR